MKEIKIVAWLCLLGFCFIACKKQTNDTNINSQLKIYNFNSDKIIGTNVNSFICIDYLSASIIKVDSEGKILWKQHNLFFSKDPANKSEEKPVINTLNDGTIMIWEQITDTFIVNTAQIYSHWNITKLDAFGKIQFKKNITTKDKKKVLPFTVVEINNEIIGLGIVETNKISGAISVLKINENGDLIWNKSINPAGYWLNGVFPNANTYINTTVNNQNVFSIIQIGTQTSCFKFDTEGKIILYKRFNYATDFNVQQQINTSSFWEYTISNFISINDDEFLITGTKFSGSNNLSSNNSYYQEIYTAKINTSFDSIVSKRYGANNFQNGAFPFINKDNSFSIISGESEDIGGDSYLKILKINQNDLSVNQNYIYRSLVNYQGYSGVSHAEIGLSIVGVNSAFNSNNKHTFFLKVKGDGSL